MFDKPALLIVVIAIFIAAVWITESPKTGRRVQSEWLRERLDVHQRYAYTQVIDDFGQARPGYALSGQDAIRRLYRECGSY